MFNYKKMTDFSFFTTSVSCSLVLLSVKQIFSVFPLSHHGLSHLILASHLVASRLAASCLVKSRLVASHLVASQLLATPLFTPWLVLS